MRSLTKNAAHVDLALAKNFDVYVFTETWLKSHHIVSSLLVHMSGDYQTLRCDRARKAGGGVAIIFKSSLGFVKIFSESIPNSYEILSADLVLDGISVRFIVVYRAPSCKSAENEQLVKSISDLMACEHASVIMGDFNYPDIDWSILPSSQSLLLNTNPFVEMVCSHGLVQHVLEPTRGEHILDLVLSTDVSIIKSISVEAPVGLSDHNSVKFDMCYTLTEPVYTYSRQFNRCDYDKVCDYLAAVAWRRMFETFDTVNEKYEFFISTLQLSIDLFVPWARVSVKHSCLPSYLQNMLDHRSCLFRAALHSQAERDWEKYNLFSKKFHKALQKYNGSIEKRIIQSGNKAGFYKLLRRNLKSGSYVGSIVNGSQVAVTELDKANVLADKFCEVFLSDDEGMPVFRAEASEPMQSFPWFTKEELYRIIVGWSDSSSLTPDFIPAFFIKKVAHVVVGPLSYLFNQSLIHAEVPARWKHSFVTPLLKKNPASG